MRRVDQLSITMCWLATVRNLGAARRLDSFYSSSSVDLFRAFLVLYKNLNKDNPSVLEFHPDSVWVVRVLTSSLPFGHSM